MRCDLRQGGGGRVGGQKGTQESGRPAWGDGEGRRGQGHGGGREWRHQWEGRGGAGARLREGVVSGWDLWRRVFRVTQGDGAGARLRVVGAGGEIVPRGTQRGDGAARRQHRAVLKAGGEGAGGGG